MDDGQTVVVSQAPPVHLQVEADASTSYAGGTAHQSARLSKIGLGLVGLMLIGASACALIQSSSPSASMPGSELAFTPTLPAFRSGGALTRLPMRASAVTAPRDVKMQFGRKPPAKPTAKPAAAGPFGFFGQKATTKQTKSKVKPSRVPKKTGAKTKDTSKPNYGTPKFLLKKEDKVDTSSMTFKEKIDEFYKSSEGPKGDVGRKFVINSGLLTAATAAFLAVNGKESKQLPWRERKPEQETKMSKELKQKSLKGLEYKPRATNSQGSPAVKDPAAKSFEEGMAAITKANTGTR